MYCLSLPQAWLDCTLDVAQNGATVCFVDFFKQGTAGELMAHDASLEIQTLAKKQVFRTALGETYGNLPSTRWNHPEISQHTRKDSSSLHP